MEDVDLEKSGRISNMHYLILHTGYQHTQPQGLIPKLLSYNFEFCIRQLFFNAGLVHQYSDALSVGAQPAFNVRCHL